MAQTKEQRAAYGRTAKGKAHRARYRASAKGKATRVAYRASTKGKATSRAAYHRSPELRRASAAAYHARRYGPRHPKSSHCEICHRSSPLVADHDHQTNKFRGWLCRTCNMGLGMFGDNREIMSAAINYVTATLR